MKERRSRQDRLSPDRPGAIGSDDPRAASGRSDRRGKGRPARWLLRAFLSVFFLLALAAGYVAWDWWHCLPESVQAEYVGRQSCASCHEQECKLWEGSDHDLAMDRALPETVLGDFNDREFLHIAFSELWRLPEDELRRLVEHIPDDVLATALQEYEPPPMPELGIEHPSGRESRKRIAAALSDERRAAILEETAWKKQFARPCDITAAHRTIRDIAAKMTEAGELHPDFAVRSRMFQRDGKFFVETDDRDGTLREFEVRYVFGVYPLQQYLVEFPDGRIQCLPLAWDVKSKSWFHLYPSEPIPHNDPLHWTGSLQNWNYMCADCHTTNLRKNFDVASNTYRTTWSEIDVSCETCHGPASVHVRLAESWSLFWDRKRGYGLPQLKGAPNTVLVDSCAPCHARRRPLKEGFVGGNHFLDHYLPEFLDGQLYYDDGQILDEDYEYGSFTQSLMYRKGVRCLDCHDAHTGRIKFAEATRPGEIRKPYTDNRLCGQCHVPAKYDTPAHHFHPKVGEPGSRCVDCHMPETTYMVVDARRDHSLRVPRPDLTVSLGIPNACNLCHQDRAKGESPQWAADWIEKWYGRKPDRNHFAYAFAAGKRGDVAAAADLAAVVRRQDLSGMVRASALLILSRASPQSALGSIVASAGAPDPLLRIAAARALQNLPPDPGTLARVKNLFEDPIRAARLEAFPWLIQFAPQDRRLLSADVLDRLVKEYVAAQKLVDDQPGAHVNLALLYDALERPDEAEAEYQTALRLDPGFLPARNNLAMLFARQSRWEEAEQQYRLAIGADPDYIPVRDNLARLYYQQGRTTDAEREFRAILEKVPTLGDVWFSLGLLIAEDPARLAEAADCLKRAADLMPGDARVAYNAGLALHKAGELEEAETLFTRAYRLGDPSPDLLQAYALLMVDLRRCAAARSLADELRARFPSPSAEQFYRAVVSRCGEGAAP
ncbi:tetratricopeptide repeat protein [Thermopirellula anaerolimosa]